MPHHVPWNLRCDFSWYLSYCLYGKGHYDQSNLLKKAFNWRLTCSFRRLLYYCHGWEHGGTWESIVLEKELRVLHPHVWHAERNRDAGPGLGFCDLKVHPQWHISSNMATPPNHSKIVLLPGKQALKDMSRCGQSSLTYYICQEGQYRCDEIKAPETRSFTILPEQDQERTTRGLGQRERRNTRASNSGNL